MVFERLRTPRGKMWEEMGKIPGAAEGDGRLRECKKK